LISCSLVVLIHGRLGLFSSSSLFSIFASLGLIWAFIILLMIGG